MENWPLILQLGILVGVIALLAVPAIDYALRSRRGGAPPVIRASMRELQKAWFQLDIAIANRAPYE